MKATKSTAYVRKFTVSERWVEIAVSVISSHFEMMKGQKFYSHHWHTDIVRAYFNKLSIVIQNHHGAYDGLGVMPTKSLEEDAQEYRTDGMIWGDMRGRRDQANFTFVVMESEWQKMNQHAAAIGAKPEALVRAALAKRIHLWQQMAANEAVKVTFSMPASEIRDFRSYMANSRSPGGKSNPELFSISVGTPRSDKKLEPFNKATNGVASNKMRLVRIKRLMKVERCETLTFDLCRDFWRNIEEAAEFYGITPEEHCQCCLSYHAALWRKDEEKRRPKSSLERFERGLASDARKHRHEKAGMVN